MKIISGGVCAAKGFKANGMHCGIRHNQTKKENPKPSDAESSAKPLGRSPALTLGGFLDL